MIVYLGLGANLGNRLANLQDGLRRLEAEAPVAAVSSLYESEPVGPPGQPRYLNAAARLDTALAARPLLVALKRIEWEMGRRPGVVWGPRPLDMDILLYGDEQIDEPDLVVPHPRMAERPFVLVPLAEIAPDVHHPVLGATIAALRDAAGEAGLRRLAGPEWLRLRALPETA